MHEYLLHRNLCQPRRVKKLDDPISDDLLQDEKDIWNVAWFILDFLLELDKKSSDKT